MSDDKPAVTIGICRKIQNMDDGTCRMWVDIGKESTPGNIFTWLWKNVIVALTTLTPADKPGKVQEEAVRVRKFGGRTLKVMK